MDQIEKIRRVVSAIVTAPPQRGFGDIVESERDAFRGLHVTYATRITDLYIHQVRLDQVREECPLVHSFFDGSGLLFYSDAVYSDTLEGQAKILLDYSIMLDKNVCEQIRRYVNGSQSSNPEALGQLLNLVRGRREQGFNYDFMAYLAEELEHFHKPDNDRPLQTFRALKRLDFLDETSLPTYPKLFTSSAVEIAVQRAVDEMITKAIRTGALADLQRCQLVGYAVLLQALLLRWDGASLESGMKSLVKFSINTFGKLAKIELYFGSKLLTSNRSLPRFFQPIATPSRSALGKARSMSWDLTLFRAAEIMAVVGRRVGGQTPEFFLPFLASFDGKFTDMVAACPLRAIVVDRNINKINSIFRDEEDFQIVLAEAIGRAGIVVGNAAQARRSDADVDEPNLKRAIALLERRVAEVAGS